MAARFAARITKLGLREIGSAAVSAKPERGPPFVTRLLDALAEQLRTVESRCRTNPHADVEVRLANADGAFETAHYP